ncbi:MAG: hypothetical protein DWB56_08695 [Candidatus Jettenia sp.]|uniref:Uncharacterized protein n=1 Tax=Candidatus Jettenia caeni TaxID=247490 RepID=I3IK00_9BACT|nr:hypothetical protein [Candidatus Jettenia sp. AMX1]MBC6929022.1 hypothetical protein [Candidatus Jettenia sp.]WKZ17308.1 MAG: hypothetical protein QY317_08320 [Candidatus Jettenia caeni]KAA0249249.1 MAG: hypothetical protein EDM77_09625 [Candidatus Jettenia sp. AMX1]MCE7881127.1 hypothetical protein [Candidatus Jettenia sp. AMX1]MCQ3927201.1 hypothetical protein [Candidatus Jettenia sp.]
MKIVRKTFQIISTYTVLGFLTTVSLQQISIAAWSSFAKENTAICMAPGQQSLPQIVSDGAGGAIITWEDARDVHFDIYAQRIDAHGNVLWNKDGVPVCTVPENQNRPKIISDGAGGAIITWHDVRSGSGNYDIYAQRIDADGKPQWASNGMPICTEVNAQNSPCIVMDGAGGTIIIWQDFRTNYADLYAQRIRKDGELLWKENGVLICGSSGAQSAPIAVDDTTGGAIVIWQDFRRSYADIYAQRVDGGGNILWDRGGVPLCTASGHESFQVVINNGAEGAIIAWVDTRNGNNDIFAQQIDGNGAVYWQTNGIPLCIAKGNQNYPVITGDGAGGAILAWWDMRSGVFDIYAQRIELTGNIPWMENGIPICVESGIQNNVSITSNGSGGAIVTWNDNRADMFDVYAQQIDSKGLAQWSGKGVPCSTASDTQCFPVLVRDGAGGVIITWQDGRNKDKSYWDIYAQKINSQGFLGDE